MGVGQSGLMYREGNATQKGSFSSGRVPWEMLFVKPSDRPCRLFEGNVILQAAKLTLLMINMTFGGITDP